MCEVANKCKTHDELGEYGNDKTISFQPGPEYINLIKICFTIMNVINEKKVINTLFLRNLHKKYHVTESENLPSSYLD